MASYMYLGRYTGEGCRGVLAEGGTQREAETRQAFHAIGGRVDTYLFAVGSDFDFVIIADMPDNTTAIVPPLLASSSGTVIVRTTPLLSPKDLDAATELARRVSFRAAGEA